MTRQYLFVKKNRKLENIPPTSAAFHEHLKRAILQGVLCWGSTTNRKINLPDPALWGWQKVGCTYEPFWTIKPEISIACSAFLKCLCKKQCGARCTCVKAGISCAVFCACDGKCHKENATSTRSNSMEIENSTQNISYLFSE